MNTTIIMIGCCAILTLFATILVIAMVHYGYRTSAITKVLINHFNGIRTVENIVMRLEEKVKEKASTSEIEERLDKLEKTVERLAMYVDMEIVYPSKKDKSSK